MAYLCLQRIWLLEAKPSSAARSYSDLAEAGLISCFLALRSLKGETNYEIIVIMILMIIGSNPRILDT